MKQMMFTLWDVGHGLSIWIKTPNGHNHWIDAGWYPDTNFSPSKHVKDHYGETQLDLLIISHPDMDHLHNLPEIVKHLGEPRVFCRNKSVRDAEKYGSATLDYQMVYRNLDQKYNAPVSIAASPFDAGYNGGITVKTRYLNYVTDMSINDSSVVAFYGYAGWLFVLPGDIESTGWGNLWKQYSEIFQPLISGAKYKILVAPHHGRSSGYSDAMMNTLSPNLVLISDKYGKEPTDSRFRDNPKGISYQDNLVKYFTTKTGGRMQFTIKDDGTCNFTQL
ncbi:MAG: ComEC/Rec2 family competence protein [Kiritimatiellia bacterium]